MADEMFVELGDGSKIVVKDGNYEEAFKEAVKMADNKAQYISGLNTKINTLETDRNQLVQKVNELSAPPPKKVESGAFDPAEYYKLLNVDPDAANSYWFEKKFGQRPEDVSQNFQQVAQKVGDFEQRLVAADFVQQHPDFPQEAAAATLLRQRTQELLQEGHPFNTRTLAMAYDDLVSTEKIKPVKVETQKTEEEKPNPSLHGTSQQAESDELAKFERMTTAEQEAYLRAKGMFA